MSEWIDNAVESGDGLRPLPVLVLADCSGSMDGQKINVLNHALAEMLADMKAFRAPEGEVHLGLISFADEARWVLPLGQLGSVSLPTLTASGGTNMGAAIDLMLRKLLDRSWQKRNYRPLVIMLSDGQPTDGSAVSRALQEVGRDSKARQAQRLALAIGDDADVDMLGRFVGPEQPVLRVHDPKRIIDFLNLVTWVSTMTIQNQDRAPIVVPDGSVVQTTPGGTKFVELDDQNVVDV